MKKVRIISPSSPTFNCDTGMVKKVFADMGFEAEFAKHALDVNRFMAGTDEARARDVMDAFTDDSADVICALRGGAGSARILDKLDYKLIAKNKKPLFGFSDTTALQLALWAKCGLISFTGALALFLKDEEHLRTPFKECVARKPIRIKGLKKMVAGVGTGRIIAGTLSLIADLVGTEYMPDMTGVILVLEQPDEEPYRIDRRLTHLRQAGCFDQLAGVVLGDFYNCEPKDKKDGTVEEVLCDHFGQMQVPVVSGLKYSHDVNTVILPIGAAAVLNANKGTLEIEEY